MKKKLKALKSPIAFAFFLTSLIACDKDFSTIKSDVLGEGNANFKTGVDTLAVTAYSKKLEALKINNLASNLLGVFDDPAYGQTTASIITQITPATYSPDFGENPIIEEVILTVPYFSTSIGTDNDGTNYKLDSIYGDPSTAFKLTLYRNNYFLKDSNLNSEDNNPQNYYSNAGNTSHSIINETTTVNFDDYIIGVNIFEGNVFDAFTPSNEEIVITTGEVDDEVKTRSVPALRGILDNSFWQNAIINASINNPSILSNANSFKDYFRGLYFKVEAINDSAGSMILLNLAANNANITMHYKKGEAGDRIDDSYTLNFSGNILNTFINDFDATLTDGDKDLGDKKLYLKGSEGSMAIVDLFANEAERQNFRNAFLDADENQIKLVNEAHLVIYEDEEMPTNDADANGDAYHKYDRIYAYDVNNNLPLIDTAEGLDPTVNSQNPLFSKIFSLGQRDSISPEIARYKIRITQHINNIIQNDSTNTKIGLVLSNNVNYTANSQILNSNDDVTAVPSASILSPRGTILYGSNESVSKSKRLKLILYFTELKEN